MKTEQKLTRSQFQELPTEAVVRVQYSSGRITDFDQKFTRVPTEGAVKVSQREWLAMWDTYHDFEADSVEFTQV